MPDIAAPALARSRYTFTVPEGARTFPEDPSSFVMVPITAREERLAHETAMAAKIMPVWELVKHAVIEVDGKALTWNGQERDWIERCGPKVRELVYAAYRKVNELDKADVDDFLSQATVTAG